MLQEPFVTVRQEKRNSYTEKMSQNVMEKMCGSPHNVITRMGQQWLKKK